jgi:hypothetical protein
MLSLGLEGPREGSVYHVLWFLNQERYSTKLPSFSPLFNIQGVGVRGERSPWVMFSKRGEKQFVPHGTKAVEHSAEIFLHLMDIDRNIGIRHFYFGF